MEKVTYKSYSQNDSLLFPHCIGDFIPENDPVRVLDAIVEHLDICNHGQTYKDQFSHKSYLVVNIFTDVQ